MQPDRPQPLDGSDNREKVPSNKTLPRQTRPSGTTPSSSLPQRFEKERKIGKYELRGLLGKGGVGVVYLGYDPDIEREVAIKVLHPDMAEDSNILQRFLAEARAVGQLNHPNTIAIYELGIDDGAHFIVMELARGGSLSERLGKTTRLSFDEARRIAIEAARGLEAAHKAGIIHRDVKPSNLMLCSDGGVKLVDFGLSKRVTDGSEMHLTQTGEVIGTPIYMSPEQIQSEPIDARTDIYGLGATLHHLLTGQPPFETDSIAALVFSHVMKPRPDPCSLVPDLPVACSSIIAKAMAVKPEDRYPSMRALLADLEGLPTTLQNLENTRVSNLFRVKIPHVLITDPSTLGGRVIADIFRKAGCRNVTCVQSGGEAINHVRTHPVDVIATARQLRDLTGEELVHQLQHLPNAAEAIGVVMSCDSPQDMIAQSTAKSKLAFLTKQLNSSKILTAVYAGVTFDFPGVEAFHRDVTGLRVAIVSKDGLIPPSLEELLGGEGVLKITNKTFEEVTQTPELEPADCLIWIVESNESFSEIVRQTPAQMVQWTEEGGLLVVVSVEEDELYVHGVVGNVFGVCLDRRLTGSILRRLLQSR